MTGFSGQQFDALKVSKSWQFLLLLEQRKCIDIRYFCEAKNWSKVEDDFIDKQSKREGSPCTWMIDKISTSNGKLTPSVAAAALQLGIFVGEKRQRKFSKKKILAIVLFILWTSAPSSEWASCLRNEIVNKLYIFALCTARCCAIMQSCKFCTHPQFVKLQVQGYKVATLILRSFILTPVHPKNPSDGSIFWVFDVS